jgi:hypothetical protein
MNTNNSISSVIKQLLEINVNSLKTFERINEAITTDKQSVPLELLTPEGTQTVFVPSFGFMKRELERLDQNIKALTDLGGSTSRVKLADGSYQKIYTGSLKGAPNSIDSVNRPVRFNVKSNYFFEDFLSPLLTAKFNITNQIDADTERVLVKRLIIDTSTEFGRDFFESEFKDRDGLLYNDVISLLDANNIKYVNDEEVRDLPYRNVQYYGSFDITSIDNIQKPVVENGQSVLRNVKVYTLDQLTYTDSEKTLKNTETLKVGDELLVNSGNKSTKYQIKSIDSSTRRVELALIQGYEPIRIGVDVLSIYKINQLSVEIEINVGFDESIVVFFKAIDPYSNILSEDWSPGAGFYSNDLIATFESGEVKTLAQYYKESVADFGQFIKSLQKDMIPPATVGVKPDPPSINSANFKVVQINQHLTENDAINKVQKLNSDKINTEEKLKSIDDTIVKKRSTISTKKYKSIIERDKDRNELKSLIDTRASETKLYSSLVNEIKSIALDKEIIDISPKFRVRGFWSIPEPKLAIGTIPQEIVQFVIQYRYLSTDGKSSNIEQIKFIDGTNEKTGVFSNWNEIKTGVRERVKDQKTGKYFWGTSSVEDGQVVNFNQLDIPIQKGEIVEIRIKSVSEAGYPANPIVSDWSNIIAVEFPEGKFVTNSINSLVVENQTESVVVKINSELDSKGVYKHIDDSFIANEKYFSHNASTIASGFLSVEQNPISLFDKLTQLQNEIKSLQDSLSGIKGELLVKLVSDDGTVININKNTNNKVFAGYYVDEVADLTIKKGHIVTKTFKLLLENTRASKLELIARITGDRNLPVYRSSANLSTPVTNGFGVDLGGLDSSTVSGIHSRVINDTYYTTEGKYDIVPIQYQNLSQGEDLELYAGETYNHAVPYQSAQRRGQFIYSRFMDIANDKELYSVAPFGVATNSINDYEYQLAYSGILPTTGNAGASTDYIWTGTFGVNLASGVEPYDLSVAFGATLIDVTSVGTLTSALYDTGLYLHKDHPDLENLYSTYSTSAVDPLAVLDIEMLAAINAVKEASLYSMSIPATYEGDSTDGKKQLGYRSTQLPDGTTRTLKMSFDANDQYLLGGKSCGSYLFMAPINTESLLVDGDNKFGRKYITTGESKAVSLDVVFQYRMTDYSGDSPSTDIGRIGGLFGTNLSNLTYSKKMGIDVFDFDGEQFSFDLEIFSKYKAVGSNKNTIKAAQLTI